MNIILKSPGGIFTFKELVILLMEERPDLLKRRLNYYVKKGELYSPRRGLYAKGKDYNPYELGVKIYAPSYVSFESVLTAEGVIFQRNKTISIASYLSRVISIGGYKFHYRKLTERLLYDSSGIETNIRYSIASKERALLDMLYMNINYHFDNLRGINRLKAKKIATIYKSIKIEKKLVEILERGNR